LDNFSRSPVIVGALCATIWIGIFGLNTKVLADDSAYVTSGSITPGGTTLGGTTTGQCDITSGATNACTLDLSGSTNGAITQVYSSADLSTTVCTHAVGCYNAVRSDPGSAIAPIDVWNACRYVDNTSSGSTGVSNFVPFHTAYEWSQFYNSYNHPGYLSVVYCSRPFPPTTTWVVPSPSSVGLSTYSTAGCGDAPTVNAPTIYSRWYSPTHFATWPMPTPESVQFTSCHSGWTTINAQVLWSGQQSADGVAPAPSWWPVVTFGPDLTFTASASTMSGPVSGSAITVLAGTLVTLNWDASLSDTSTSQDSVSPVVTSTLNGTSGNTVTGSSFISSTVPTVTGLVAVTTGTGGYSIESTDNTGASSVALTPLGVTTTPHSNVSYTITDLGDKDVTSLAKVTITVEQPITVSLIATPIILALNTASSSTLTWTVTLPPPGLSCSINGTSVSTAGGTLVVSPVATTTYTLVCEDTLQKQTASVTVISCPSDVDISGVCTTPTYTPTYGGSCPSACGLGTSTIPVATCTRNDGAVVADSYCSGLSCGATASCNVSCTSQILTQLSVTVPAGGASIMYTMVGGAGGSYYAGGGGGSSAIVVNGTVQASAAGGNGSSGCCQGNNGASSNGGPIVVAAGDTLQIYAGGGGGRGGACGGGGGSGYYGGGGGSGSYDYPIVGGGDGNYGGAGGTGSAGGAGGGAGDTGFFGASGFVGVTNGSAGAGGNGGAGLYWDGPGTTTGHTECTAGYGGVGAIGGIGGSNWVSGVFEGETPGGGGGGYGSGGGGEASGAMVGGGYGGSYGGNGGDGSGLSTWGIDYGGLGNGDGLVGVFGGADSGSVSVSYTAPSCFF